MFLQFSFKYSTVDWHFSIFDIFHKFQCFGKQPRVFNKDSTDAVCIWLLYWETLSVKFSKAIFLRSKVTLFTIGRRRVLNWKPYKHRCAFHLRHLAGNVVGKLGIAYLRYHNSQPATCFPLTATLARLAIPVLPVEWKAPRSRFTAAMALYSKIPPSLTAKSFAIWWRLQMVLFFSGVAVSNAF